MSFYMHLPHGRGTPNAIRMQNITQSGFDDPTLLYGKEALDHFPNQSTMRPFNVPW
jgi:hypothetical protein